MMHDLSEKELQIFRESRKAFLVLAKECAELDYASNGKTRYLHVMMSGMGDGIAITCAGLGNKPLEVFLKCILDAYLAHCVKFENFIKAENAPSGQA